MENEIKPKNKFGKRLAIGTLALATIAGTYFGREKDLPPIYVNKVGKSGGICVGVVTHVDKNAEFYGPIISLINRRDENSKHYGISFSAVNYNSASELHGSSVSLADINKKNPKINGLEASVLANSLDLRGDEANPYNSAPIINGAQISVLANLASKGNCVQIGVINKISKSENDGRMGLIFNAYFSGKNKNDTKTEVDK